MNNNNQYYNPGGNNNYYQPGGNNYYQPGGNNQYYYQQGGNQQYYQADPTQSNDDEDSSMNFNPLEWLFTFLHYWYLFVIAIIIALGIAYLQNRKWLPSYYSQGTIIIKETVGYGGSNSVLMQGFGVDAGYKNVQNQLIMLKSYDLACRVVDSLPYLRAEYVTQGRFKKRNLYRESPIVIEPEMVQESVYGLLFQVDFEGDGVVKITSTDEDRPFSIRARYGEPIDCPLFKATVWPTERLVESGRIYFRFRSREGLASEIMNRISLNFITDGSTVLALGLVSETPVRDCEIIDKLAEIFLLQNLEQKNEV